MGRSTHSGRPWGELDTLRGEAQPAESAPPEPAIEIDSAVTRRGWMKTAAAAAVGGTAVALSGSQPVAAADTDPIRIGQTNNTGASRTVATHTGTGGNGVSFLFKNQSAFDGSGASYPAAVGAWTGSTVRRNGLYGFSSVATGNANGVVGVNSSPQGAGVLGVAGTGVSAEGRTGVYAEGTEHGVVAAGDISALLLGPTNPVAPPDRTDGQSGGSVDVQLLSDSGAASLWFCSAPGAPGVWQKLAGPSTAGAFHAITPTRVYDSRRPQPSPGALAAGSDRVVSVADGRDLLTGAPIASGLVPDGATAITYNLTVTGTVDGGFVAIAPGSSTNFGASAINWSSSGTTIANAGVVKLGLDRQVKVFAEGGTTHFIIDVTGYYR